ncbi:MAG: Mut7-C RNAse domain-containing protein [Candidatus Bathyarchaeia archaeon]
MTEDLKFVVDGMLGKIARWLRILGYDVKYENSLDDLSLIKIAQDERRILLTRDILLYRRAIAKRINSILLEDESRFSNLVKLSREVGIKLEIDTLTSRCPKCNSRIEPVTKVSVHGKVPEKTFERLNEFWLCPNCGQVYWRGSHWRNIYSIIERVRSVS